MSRSFPVRLVLGAFVIAAAVACGEHASPTSPNAPVALASVKPALTSKPPRGHKVAECVIPRDIDLSARIGQRGGRLQLDSHNSLLIRPGALLRDMTISAHIPKGNQAKVQFAPEGLKFLLPAVLTMSYSSCVTPTIGVSVAYLRADTVTEVEPSVSDPLTKTVTAVITHFSSYAVAY